MPNDRMHPRSLAFGVCIAALILTILALPAGAQAHRSPTLQERAGIARAIAGGVRGRPFRVEIRHISVSSFGPFATASFAVVFEKGARPVPSGVVLVKSHAGKWFEAGAPGAPTIRASTAVVSDLHLYQAPPATKHPRPKKHSSGWSPHTIHLILIIGAVVLGLFLLLALIGAIAGPTGLRTGAQPARAAPDTSLGLPRQGAQPQRQLTTCPVCGGSGHARCYPCNGTGLVPDLSDPNSQEMMPCPSCGGRGWTGPCGNCNGTGKVDAG